MRGGIASTVIDNGSLIFNDLLKFSQFPAEKVKVGTSFTAFPEALYINLCR